MKGYPFKILSILVTITLSVIGSTANAEDKATLNTKFQQVVTSFTGDEMIVSCGHGGHTFRVTSSILTKPRLYWKNGIEWQELENSNFKDTGIVFQGLSRKGGVPLSDLNIDVELPIFRKWGLTDADYQKNYFVKSRESIRLDPYEYVLDMLEGTLTSRNIFPVTDFIKLDAKKYYLEQSSLPVSFTYTEEQKYKEEIELKSHLEAVQAVIERYSKEIEVETAARSYLTSHHCRLE